MPTKIESSTFPENFYPSFSASITTKIRINGPWRFKKRAQEFQMDKFQVFFSIFTHLSNSWYATNSKKKKNLFQDSSFDEATNTISESKDGHTSNVMYCNDVVYSLIRLVQVAIFFSHLPLFPPI